jgi:ATP-dependent DNA helicase 2 subunit 1
VEETSELITKDRIQHYITLGDYHLPISPHELIGIKMNANASGNNISLILIGFKPMELLQYKHIIDKALFAYPSDDDVKGSTRSFIALHRSMLRKGVMALCEYLPRRASSSRQVAMIPHEGDSYAPKGFLILPLPYREDIRNTPNNRISHDEYDLTTETFDLIKSQLIVDAIDYKTAFWNPALKNFWSFIESIALDMPLDDRATNFEINSGIGTVVPNSVIESLRAALPEEESSIKVSRRRAAHEKIVDTSGINWESVYATNSWMKYKVDELKAYLRSIGEKTTGNKSVLINRIKEYLDARCDTTDH